MQDIESLFLSEMPINFCSAFLFPGSFCSIMLFTQLFILLLSLFFLLLHLGLDFLKFLANILIFNVKFFLLVFQIL